MNVVLKLHGADIPTLGWWESLPVDSNVWVPIAAVILGIVLGWIPERWARSRRIVSHWNFIRAEIEECGRRACGLVLPDNRDLKTAVLAPLFRLPSVSYTTSFPALLAEQKISADEAAALVTYFTQVDDVNRGLDYANELHTANDIKNLERERTRIGMKAAKIRADKSDLYKTCLQIINTHIP